MASSITTKWRPSVATTRIDGEGGRSGWSFGRREHLGEQHRDVAQKDPGGSPGISGILTHCFDRGYRRGNDFDEDNVSLAQQTLTASRDFRIDRSGRGSHKHHVYTRVWKPMTSMKLILMVQKEDNNLNGLLNALKQRQSKEKEGF